MLERHTERHLIERRMIESSNSEVIKIHSDPLRSTQIHSDLIMDPIRGDQIQSDLIMDPIRGDQRQSRTGFSMSHLDWPRGNGAPVRPVGKLARRRLALVALPPNTALTPNTALPP